MQQSLLHPSTSSCPLPPQLPPPFPPRAFFSYLCFLSFSLFGLFVNCVNFLITICTFDKHGIVHSSSVLLSSLPPPTTSINDLNDDALVEILSRLPIKGLVRSMCVSKLWYRLVSTICIPKITTTPVNAILFNIGRVSPYKKKGPWSLVWVNSPMKITSLVDLCSSLPFTPSPNDFLDCCNGVFLFFDRSMRQYYVCNPATEQWFDIPDSPIEPPICGALIFYPHYKVVHISRLSPFTMSIFSPETREWTEHTLHLEPSIVIYGLVKARTVFVDGSLYMLSASGYLLKIDMKRMCARAIELPEIVLRGEHPIGCIGMSQGRLHYSWGNMVWMLDDAGEWALKHIIGQPLCNNSTIYYPVFAFDPKSDVLFVGNTKRIYRFDPYTKVLEAVCKLNDKANDSIYAGWYIVFPFWHNMTSFAEFSVAAVKPMGSHVYGRRNAIRQHRK